MKNIMEMKQRKSSLVKEARGLTETAEKEKRDLSADEKGKIDKILVDARAIDEDVAREERMQALEMNQARTEEAEKRGTEFRNFGEFLQASRWNPGDPRLVRMQARDVEGRAMDMTTGAEGGVLVPPTYMETIMQVTPQQAVFRPRATVIPAGTPPDSAMIIPTLDQSGTQGVYAGVTVKWLAEGATKAETAPALKDIQLFPREVAAYVTVTDKLLRNAEAASTLVTNLLRKAIIGSEEAAFGNGNGVGKPTGIINHASALTVNRTTANSVVYNDLVAMLAKMWFDDSQPVFIANQTCLPKLMTMTTPLGQLVWQPSAREGFPSTLLGYPLLLNQRQPALGTKGDLMFVDLPKYLIKDGSALAIEASPHVYFTNNKTVIKAYWNVDGMPWLTDSILSEDGVTRLSPFMVLDVVAT